MGTYDPDVNCTSKPHKCTKLVISTVIVGVIGTPEPPSRAWLLSSPVAPVFLSVGFSVPL